MNTTGVLVYYAMPRIVFETLEGQGFAFLQGFTVLFVALLALSLDAVFWECREKEADESMERARHHTLHTLGLFFSNFFTVPAVRDAWSCIRSVDGNACSTFIETADASSDVWCVVMGMNLYAMLAYRHTRSQAFMLQTLVFVLVYYTSMQGGNAMIAPSIVWLFMVSVIPTIMIIIVGFLRALRFDRLSAWILVGKVHDDVRETKYMNAINAFGVGMTIIVFFIMADVNVGTSHSVSVSTSLPQFLSMVLMMIAVYFGTRFPTDIHRHKISEKVPDWGVRWVPLQHYGTLMRDPVFNSLRHDSRMSSLNVQRAQYMNWCWSIVAPDLLCVQPETAYQIVRICNFARDNGYVVRPVGRLHNWSPITLEQGQDVSRVIAVNMMRFKNPVPRNICDNANHFPGVSDLYFSPPKVSHWFKPEQVTRREGDKSLFKYYFRPSVTRAEVPGHNDVDVTFGCGTTIHEATSFLERIPHTGPIIIESQQQAPVLRLKGAIFMREARRAIKGFFKMIYITFLAPEIMPVDPEDQVPASGYAWQSITGVGDVSLGGVLSIGGHGTFVPYTNAPDPRYAGSLSNQIVGFTAVVTDPNSATPDDYIVKYFHRSDPDSAAFLVHLGRAFILDVTMRCRQNYYLREKTHIQPIGSLIGSERLRDGQSSLQTLVENHGRFELLWFPSEEEAWMKTWAEETTVMKPAVIEPYTHGNFFFWLLNRMSNALNRLARNWFAERPSISYSFASVAMAMARGIKNSGETFGLSRDQLLYVSPFTLRVSCIGGGVLARRSEIQDIVRRFVDIVDKHRRKAELVNRYPIFGPVEVRVVGVDDPNDLGIRNATLPYLSPSVPIEGREEFDVIVYVDALTIPSWTDAKTESRTPESHGVLADIELDLMREWGDLAELPEHRNRLRPEWSKGWGYSNVTGAWRNRRYLERLIPNAFPHLDDARNIFEKYDKHNLFRSALSHRIFGRGNGYKIGGNDGVDFYGREAIDYSEMR